MKALLNLSFCSMFIFGCASETQQKSLEKISEVYETKTSYSKGVVKNAGNPTISYFKVTVTSSPVIEKLVPEVASTNIALMVFEDLTDKEKQKLTHIDVEIVSSDGSSEKNLRRYSLLELENPKIQSEIFSQFSQKLIAQEYEEMIQLIDPQFQREDDASVIKNHIDKLIAKNGKITGFRRTGLGMRILENNEKRYEFIGLLVFENGVTGNYLVQTYLEASNKTIYRFHIN